MNKNPFSINDFLGYLFPGLVALMLLMYVIYMSGEEASIVDLFYLSNFLGMLETKLPGDL